MFIEEDAADKGPDRTRRGGNPELNGRLAAHCLRASQHNAKPLKEESIICLETVRIAMPTIPMTQSRRVLTNTQWCHRFLPQEAPSRRRLPGLQDCAGRWDQKGQEPPPLSRYSCLPLDVISKNELVILFLQCLALLGLDGGFSRRWTKHFLEASASSGICSCSSDRPLLFQDTGRTCASASAPQSTHHLLRAHLLLSAGAGVLHPSPGSWAKARLGRGPLQELKVTSWPASLIPGLR